MICIIENSPSKSVSDTGSPGQQLSAVIQHAWYNIRVGAHAHSTFDPPQVTINDIDEQRLSGILFDEQDLGLASFIQI